VELKNKQMNLIVCLKMSAKLWLQISVGQTELKISNNIMMDNRNVPMMVIVHFGRVIGTMKQIKIRQNVVLTK